MHAWVGRVGAGVDVADKVIRARLATTLLLPVSLALAVDGC